MDGYNQHQLYADLKTALEDLQRGQIQFEQAVGGQGGHQVEQGGHGLQQVIAAVETAMTDTTNGDLDWLAEGWGQVVGLLLQDIVHPADVVALEEGAQEPPAPPVGSPDEQVDLLLRNARAVMHFVPVGGEQMRQLLAAVLVWKQQAGGASIEVDTQTTDAGEHQGQPATQPSAGPWIPPLNTEQWTGSLPSPTLQSSTPEGDRFEPTDEDLLQALEEFERREETEVLQHATGEQLEEPPARAQLSEGDPK